MLTALRILQSGLALLAKKHFAFNMVFVEHYYEISYNLTVRVSAYPAASLQESGQED